MIVCNTSVDWAATGSMLQGIGTIGGTIALIFATIQGANTFKIWRLQKITEHKQEHAKQILNAAYNARRAFEFIRGVMILGHELHAAKVELEQKEGWNNQFKDRKDRLITAQALLNRMNKSKDQRLALDECLPMARAIFGENLEKSVENLIRQFFIVQLDIEAYVDDDGKYDPNFSAKIRRGMYAVDPRDGEINEVTEAINTSIASIENVCLPILRTD